MTRIGKYELLSFLGEGATAEVHHARDTVLGREVALKLLKPSLVTDPNSFARFMQEARAAAILFHPHIATVFEMDQADGRYFIAMRYIAGHSLRSWLDTKGPLSWDETLKMVTQVGSALDYAHGEGFLHRDVKPGNILRSKKGEYILTDFGLTRAMMATGLTSHTGAILGTPSYIAPEIWLGEEAVPATDQYALACVVYEALTGKVLFEGNTPPAVMTAHMLQAPKLFPIWSEKVPQGLSDVLLKALLPDSKKRFANILSFSDALDSQKSLNNKQDDERNTWDLKQDSEDNVYKEQETDGVVQSSGETSDWNKSRNSQANLGNHDSLKKEGINKIFAINSKYGTRTWQILLLLLLIIAILSFVGLQALNISQRAGSNVTALSCPSLDSPNYMAQISENVTFQSKFSPDGNLLAAHMLTLDSSSGILEFLQIWDMTTMNSVYKVSGKISSIAFSNDGTFLAYGTEDGYINILETDGFEEYNVIKAHSTGTQEQYTDRQTVTSISFSPDNKFIVSGGADWNLFLWDIDSGELIHSFSEHSNMVQDVAISPNGNLLAASIGYTNDRGNTDIAVYLWDLESKKLVQKLGSDFANWHNVADSILFSPDGRYLVTGNFEGTLIWDLNSYNQFRELDGTWGAFDLSFSQDGNWLAIGTYNEAQIWNINAGELIENFVMPNYELVDNYYSDFERQCKRGIAYGVDFNPKEKIFVTGSGSGLYLWSLEP